MTKNKPVENEIKIGAAVRAVTTGMELNYDKMDLPKEFFKLRDEVSPAYIIPAGIDSPRMAGGEMFVVAASPERSSFEGVDVKTAVLDNVRLHVAGFANAGIEKITGPIICAQANKPGKLEYRAQYRVIRPD